MATTRMYFLTVVLVDGTFRDHAEIEILNPRTGRTMEKNIPWGEFRKGYVELLDVDQKKKHYLPSSPSLYCAELFLGQQADTSPRMRVWPYGTDKNGARLLPIRVFVQFFIIFVTVRFLVGIWQ